MWIDSHAHLGDADDSRLAEVVSEAHAHGVDRILDVATSLSSSISVVRQCGLHPCLRAAAGISPFDVTDAGPDWLPRLDTIAKAPSVVALGETGMDDTNPAYPLLSLQRGFFESHLCLANSLDLPVIVHSRGCEQEALDICKSLGVRRAVFHCYTGPLETLTRIIDAGYAVSFSGKITYKNSPLTPLVSYAPLSSMLIETDSPYCTPVPHRSEQNRPAWVSYVGSAVAAIKHIDEQECGRSLEETFSSVFGKHGASGPVMRPMPRS
jgi:TatD DNase family protein